MRGHLMQMLQAGITACHPGRVLPPHLPEAERVVVLALGKAAGEMAKVAEAHYPDATGLAVVPHGVAAALARIELRHAGHPLPDADSVAAAEQLLQRARAAGPGELLLVLLSGGASALACLPGENLSLAGKRALIIALMRRGAAIGEINCVRRHLSRFKGGRLAQASRATLLTLAISDVEGDRTEDIGSGPTAADPSNVAQAQAILGRHGIAAPDRGWSETPKAVAGEVRIVARNADAIAAAADAARALGYRPRILGEIYGDAREAGVAHAALARTAARGTALISGGELTSAHEAGGIGGSNHVYALAAAERLAGTSGIVGLAADSDGIDGNSGAAGAFFDGTSLTRGGAAAAPLAGGDSGAYFARIGDQLVTGPTGTNVNDLRIILVGH